MAVDFYNVISKYGLATGSVGNADQSYNSAPQGTAPKPSFLGNLGHSVAGVAGAVGNFAVHTVTDVGQHAANLGMGEYKDISNQYKANNLESRNKQLQHKQDALIHAYATKQISKADYRKGLKSLQTEGQKFSNEAKKVGKESQYKMGQAAGDYIPVAAAALTAAAPFAAPGVGALEGVAGASRIAKGLDETLAAGKTLGNNPATAIAGKVARNALVSQPTAQIPGQVVKDVKDKNYGDIALQAGLLAGIPAAAKYLGPVAGEAVQAVKNKAFGVRSFLDEIPTAGAKIGDFLTGASNKHTDIAKMFQKFNLDQSKGSVDTAVNKYVHWLGGPEASAKFTAEQHLNKFDEFMKDVEKVRTAATDGTLLKPNGEAFTAEEAKNLWVGRFDQGEKADLISSLKAAKTPAERGAIAGRLAEQQQWGQNDYLKGQVIKAAKGEDFEKAINSHFQGTRSVGLSSPAEVPTSPTDTLPEGHPLKTTPSVPVSTTPELTSGHFPVLRDKITTEFTPAGEAGDIVRGVAPSKTLGRIGKTLEKAGLSPQAGDNQALRASIRDNFDKHMTELTGGDTSKNSQILNKLYDGTETRLGAYDPRLLRKSEIGQILGVDTKSAGQIRTALDKAYSEVPLSTRGLGPKVTDFALSHGERGYLRVQNIGRFSKFNPFFQSKVAIKSALIAQAESGGQGFGKVAPEIENYVKSSGGRTVESSIADYIGGDTSNLRPGVVGKFQQNLANNTVKTLLEKNGATLAELEKNPALKHEIDHAIQTIYGYPKGGYLDSNLAKSLNLVLFPSRFEAKVASAGVKFLAKQPPITRAVIINTLINADKWAGSSEGTKWQRDNSELVGLIKYATPLKTVSDVMSLLTKPGETHVQDLGSIGGLPLGVITQILSNQGVALGRLGSSEYLNPKTGEFDGKKIPQNTQARFKQGMTDLIGSLFSYPGKTAGLRSKTDLVQGLDPTGLLKPKPGDFKYVGGTESKPGAVVASPYTAPGKVPTLPKTTVGIGAPKAAKVAKPKIRAKRPGQPF